MQNNTSKMVALLGKIRKQMNGAMLDTFRYYGSNYGVNYGVALHTLRDMAQEIGIDHSLASFLYLQQVRELRVIALWIADSNAVKSADFDFWAKGIVNSEVAEQAAHALLCKITDIDLLLDKWCSGENSLIAYSAHLAASRSSIVSFDAIQRAVYKTVSNFPDNRLAAQGCVASLASQIPANRVAIQDIIKNLPQSPTAEIIRDEISWRLEY